MEPRAGCDVYIQVRMVHPVKAPHHRYLVENHVLGINCKVKHNDGGSTIEPSREGELVEQPPVFLFSEHGRSHGCRRKDDPEQKAVDYSQAEIIRPAGKLVLLKRSTGQKRFPGGHEKKIPAKKPIRTNISWSIRSMFMVSTNLLLRNQPPRPTLCSVKPLIQRAEAPDRWSAPGFTTSRGEQRIPAGQFSCSGHTPEVCFIFR